MTNPATAAPTDPPRVTEHIGRIDVYRTAPDVYEAMLALSKASHGPLDPALVELMEIRASQINHCAWCLRLHTSAALAEGVPQHKLFLLDAWEEAGALFSERERAALALTEAITLITDGFVPDEVYERAAAAFTPVEVAHLIAVATTINAFNRISVAARRTPRFHA